MPRATLSSAAPDQCAGAHNRRYAIISPCRDEAAYAEQTLESVVTQSVPPALWVIVDDGSTDGTTEILESYAARYPFLHVVQRHDRGRRSVGPGVVDAFYAGLKHLELDQFEYICKLDLDLDLPPRYFEVLMQRMEHDRRLGTCSGKPYFPHPRTNQLISEGCGDEMSVGMTKFYRTACFRQIGGFVREVMWDGIDCHRCRMLGWRAASWDEPELRFIHLRPMGSSHRNVLIGRVRHGYGQYFMGTSLAYMLASAAFRLPRHPIGIGAAAMLWGYFASKVTRRPRYGDAAFEKFIRRYQRSVLLHGKAKAVRLLDDRQRSVWNPHVPMEQETAAMHDAVEQQ